MASSLSAGNSLSNCNRTFSCGPLINVSYPFTSGDCPAHCGPPEFHLGWVGDSPELTTDSLPYCVLALDQTHRSLTLSRTDLYDNTCLSPYANTTLNSTIFIFASDNKDLALFYECWAIRTSNPKFCSVAKSMGPRQAALTRSMLSPLSAVILLTVNGSKLREALMGGFEVNYTNPYEDRCVMCEKLGQGRFGTVYEGKIKDDCLVVVKILIDLKSGLEEFINEVASISRTSHINVITLLDFCYKGKKRALTFEYVPNGLLDKFIYSGRALNMSNSLEWKILYQIAIGIAHGLAKLCHGRESAIPIHGMRGTVAFIAPEVTYQNLEKVSHKLDVYNYGMLVLDMVDVRNSNIKVSDSSEMYFQEWIYRNLEPNKDLKLPMNVTEEEEVLAR
ncbi:hypothetical protein EUGRSUZ_F02803 [Eucalyptus grandis]|uniref:Uncharacterized protein n=2 Tax=Eucalyptus grandis TaxID=71139 RepID=A0ACC3KIQ5_EUCGR|nr:hypothetical protein EUGRSUZ_F02803 [Eucalyptus grandis]